MTLAAESASVERADARTLLIGGAKLGVATAAGVVVFALLSRPVADSAEVIIQSILILAGGAVFSYVPAMWVRPRSIDGIGWTAFLGLLGALVFTVIDTAVLRPVDLYHWTWDEIGGGSGFWYIPLWWIGSATLAWLGAMVVNHTARKAPGDVNVLPLALRTVTISVVLFAILVGTGVVPFHSAGLALAFTVALVLHVPISALMNRR